MLTSILNRYDTVNEQLDHFLRNYKKGKNR